MDVRPPLIDLLEYASRMASIGERAVYALSDYRGEVFHEVALRNRVGIFHDVLEGEERVWLKIDRFSRRDPPAVPETIKGWLTVGRDPWKQPSIAKLRTVTMSIAEATAMVADGRVLQADVAPALKSRDGKAAEELRDVILRIDNDGKAQAAITAYVDGLWRSWSEEEKPRRETIAIYESMFSLQQSLATQGVERPLEIVWGVGVARWQHAGHSIDHPIVEQLVEIEIDDKDGAIRLRPRSVEPSVAVKCYQELGIVGADALMTAAREHFVRLDNEAQFSPFLRMSFEPVLRRAVSLLDSEGRFYPDELADVEDRSLPPAGPSLVITDTWVIYSRARSANIIVEDIERLKASIERTDSAELPGAAKRLVTQPDDTRPSDGFTMPMAIGSGAFGTIAERTASTASDHDFYFPKPFNDDQVDILKRLERDDGVVVQGPPGTGKTHTIANIICHFMATGRRVLVVSHGESALDVLRDQIPPEVRQLVISLLTNERAGLKQLEQAVRLLADEVSQQSQRTLGLAIDDGERRVIELRRKIAGVDTELRRCAESHLKRLGGPDGPLPMELARRVVDGRTHYGWFQDRPTVGQAPPVADDDVARLRSARKRLGEDLVYVGVALPAPNDLPDAAALAAIHEDLVNAQVISDRSRAGEVPPLSLTAERALERAEAVLGALDELTAALEARAAEPWLGSVTPTVRGPDRHSTAAPFESVRALLQKAAQGRNRFLELPVEVPEEAFKHRPLFNELRDALGRQSDDQSPFGLFAFGQGKTKAAYAEIRVAGDPVGDRAAAQHALEYLDWRRGLIQLRVHWNRLAPELGLPALEHHGESVGRWAVETHSKIVVQAAAAECHELVVSELPILFPFGLSIEGLDQDRAVARKAQTAVKMNLSRKRLESSRHRLQDTRERLQRSNAPIIREMCEFMEGVVGRPTATGLQVAEYWDGLLSKLRQIRERAPDLDTVASLAAMVEAGGAPRWAARLRAEAPVGLEDELTPSDWRSAWLWAQQEKFLRAIDARERLERLAKDRTDATAELERVFRTVVRDRTYLALNRKLSDRVRAALVMFVSAIRQIGAGTGVRARRFRRDARDAMDSCYLAVPCWIMPTWRVSESLPSIPGSFDLVIIDEASQSDVLALPAIMRGKKVLVVGDDKQVSPVAVGVEERKILQLRKNYLEGQPFASMLLPGRSLYDLMGAVFPGQRIMLKEHFRCVEPIIRFSAREFYSSPDTNETQLRPLRIPKASERLDPPLIDILVDRGHKSPSKINLSEAEVIVDEIRKISRDPAMAARSIGVVSLVGAAQAQKIQTMLLEELGEEVYVRHAIACGDSATFQGKERDIMFVSMVEAPNSHKTKTGLMFQQRFNVALSRARDRMYLVRSVDESMLKPEDLNAKVIRHFKSPMEGAPVDIENAVSLCESQFEREVFTKLAERGWRVRPQVKAGDYRIDMVVEGASDRRLAIELDGDKYHGPDRWTSDYMRQLALERMGWRFWRCWGSSWTLEPEMCLADLERTLRSMGIEPLGAAKVSAIYTEHRVVKAGAQEVGIPGGESVDVDTRDAASREDPRPSSWSASLERPERKPAEDGIIRPGDRVVVVYTDDPGHYRTINLTEDDADDPQLGIISVRRPIAIALLGLEEDDVVDLPAGDSKREATIVKVEKGVTHRQTQGRAAA